MADDYREDSASTILHWTQSRSQVKTYSIQARHFCSRSINPKIERVNGADGDSSQAMSVRRIPRLMARPVLDDLTVKPSAAQASHHLPRPIDQSTIRTNRESNAFNSGLINRLISSRVCNDQDCMCASGEGGGRPRRASITWRICVYSRYARWKTSGISWL